MSLKRLSVAAVGLALPLTALGATTASATSSHDDSPRVDIKRVWVNDDDVSVRVAYRCGDDDDSDHGRLWVKFTQRHAEYSGSRWVRCDGDWHTTRVWLDEDWGNLREGRAWVKATLVDDDHDRATDRERVWVDDD